MENSRASETKDLKDPLDDKKRGDRVWAKLKGIPFMKKHSKDESGSNKTSAASERAQASKTEEQNSSIKGQDEISNSANEHNGTVQEDNIRPEKKERPKQREDMNFFELTFDATKSLLTGLAPQGMLLEILEHDNKKQEKKDSDESIDKSSTELKKSSELSQYSSDEKTSSESTSTEQELDGQTAKSRDRTPKLITEKRLVIGNEESPAFRFLQVYLHYFAHLFYFQEWWTYPVFILLLLNPMPMLIAIAGVTGVCAFCSVLYDFLLALTHGANLEEVILHYWGLAKQEWIKFQAPEQRRKYIIVAGIVLRALPTIKKMAETYT